MTQDTRMSAPAFELYDHEKRYAAMRDAGPELYEALEKLEPFLDAIVCYASSMDEHEPNRLVVNARAALAKARGESPSTHQDRT